MKTDLKFSVLLPAYNGGEVIKETIKSILGQSDKNFELIIVDDNSTDQTEKTVKSFKDKRIKFFKNKKNLGYAKNLAVCSKFTKGEIIYLMGQDDILAKDAFLNTYQAFKISEEIGAVTRPYWWFDEDINLPVRIKEKMNSKKNEVVTITDDYGRIISVFNTLDQLSGLAFRKKYLKTPFGKDIFTAHIYPFLAIFKKHPVVFLKNYQVAIRIKTSQSRKISSVYNKSPLLSWVEMLNSVLYEVKFKKLRTFLIKNFVAVNYLGLVQIRNYGKFKYLLREIWFLLKYRWQNIFSPLFWFFNLGCVIIPPDLLRPLTDWYKNKINARFLKKVKLDDD